MRSPGCEDAEIGGHVGLGAGMRLDVDVLRARVERERALLGEDLGDVDELAAAVVALARQALGVLVREPAALGLHDGSRDVVLARDELDVLVLAPPLALHRLPEVGVDLGDRLERKAARLEMVMRGGSFLRAPPPGSHLAGARSGIFPRTSSHRAEVADADARAATIDAPVLSPSGTRRIDTPALVVDLDRMDAAIDRMASAMAERGVALRPHAKTHKSIEVGRRQLDGGARRPDGRHDRRGRGVRRCRARRPVHRLPAGAARAEGGRLRGVGGALGCASASTRPSVRVRSRTRWATIATAYRCSSRSTRAAGGRGVAPEDAGAVARAAADLGLDVIGVFTHGGHGYAGPDARDGGRRRRGPHADRGGGRRSARSASSRRGQRGLDADRTGLRARRRDRGAPGDVRVRGPAAGRARLDRARMPWRRSSSPGSSAWTRASAPVCRRRRRQDPEQGRPGVHPRPWRDPGARRRRRRAGLRLSRGGRRGGRCAAARGRAGRARRPEPHLPGREPVRQFLVVTRRRDRRHSGGSTRGAAAAERPPLGGRARARRRRGRGSPRPPRPARRRPGGRGAARRCSRRRSTAGRHAPGRHRGRGRSTSPSCSRIAAASVASGSPDTLADVVGRGPTSRARARGASWSGTRSPIVAAPPVSTAGHGRRVAAGRRRSIRRASRAASAAAAGVMTPALGRLRGVVEQQHDPLVGRPPLDREQALDPARRRDGDRDAVDRVGRQRDDPAGPQDSTAAARPAVSSGTTRARHERASIAAALQPPRRSPG